MNHPLISVIIPCHNSADTIGTAIHSILGQTYKDIEIVVVDDNSTDHTQDVVGELAARYRHIRYYKLPFDDPHRFSKRGRNINAGWMARNYGFEQVRGTLITFQDADDASLLNRIETQYRLMNQYKAAHVCIDWQQFDETLLGCSLNVDKLLAERDDVVIDAQTIARIARSAKGTAMSTLGRLHRSIPFEIKIKRVINKVFFRTLESYPCAGNSPLFKAEIAQTVKFRPLPERVWPSFTGRGADRDFNFQVAERFKKSFCFKIPLYMWRVKRQQEIYEGYDRYLLCPEK